MHKHNLLRYSVEGSLILFPCHCTYAFLHIGEKDVVCSLLWGALFPVLLWWVKDFCLQHREDWKRLRENMQLFILLLLLGSK